MEEHRTRVHGLFNQIYVTRSFFGIKTSIYTQLGMKQLTDFIVDVLIQVFFFFKQ